MCGELDAVQRRPSDADADGICDDVDPCVGEVDACGVCNGPGEIYECGCADIPAGDCDCDGNQLDALGNCGGGCEADENNDGVCDTEIQGCTNELACNYNPSATFDDGSCTVNDECGICGGNGIPSGNCDCNGNQLDALGECGGSCVADADADGICDDVDPCVGELDACGVCNGPGETYECGCSDIPEGRMRLRWQRPRRVRHLRRRRHPCRRLRLTSVAETSLTPLASAAGLVRPMQTPTASATTSTHVSENSTPVACATDQEPSTSVDAQTSLKVIATVTETSLTSAASAAVTASLLETATDGNQLDALGECGGPCEADADADGICDDVDPCVGELDACGVCNGPGEIYECGCADIPEGDCDCDGNVLDECGICGGDGIPAGDCDCEGNQLDALGECGGPCEADADADGICDDVDPCVGELDACGVCNGPGEIYECGCADIPEGDCDCDGNVLDECGICGGDGIPAGDCDCDGNVLDECGICGGDGIPAGDCDCGDALVSVAGLVWLMRMPTASATTLTRV